MIRGTHYTHTACLDLLIRNRPQPEALYDDSRGGRQLVIERKNVIWPRNYAERHARDHKIVDAVRSRLTQLIRKGNYELRLEYLFQGDDQEMKEYVDNMVEGIQRGFERVQSGAVIRSSQSARRWAFRERHLSEDYDDDYRRGLVIVFNTSSDFWKTTLPYDLPPAFDVEVKRTLVAAAGKFADYKEAFRVVLLSGQGDLEHYPSHMLHTILARVGVPPEIDEVWNSDYDYFECGEEGWLFDQVWPVVGNRDA